MLYPIELGVLVEVLSIPILTLFSKGTDFAGLGFDLARI
jgi:hypothetical protein